ncbi:MAG TPA: MarR family transcriptional regulator [Steroidobacteraceae bacterium]|nr:MarR family transcriptional regulator [Steroidobacteraceae bacterium]
MNNSDSPFEKLEDNLRALSRRMPDVPFNEILLCRLVLHMGREMATALEQKIRPFGLAEAEFRVLMTLFSQPEGVAHPGDLCSRASQSPANMSRICDALVERGLITRVLSAQDRRRMVLRMTEEGEELVRELLPKMFAPLRGMLAGFPESDQRQLITYLKRLHQNLERMDKPESAEPRE